MEVAVESANFLLGKLDGACGEGKEGIITSALDVLARVPLGAALADDYIADFGDLAAEQFNTESFGLRVSA